MAKPVTLVLGGLGVKGIASIGVLQSFSEHNIRIKRIVAAGISALVAGEFALGGDLSQLDELFISFFQNNHRFLWGLEQVSGLFQSRRRRVVGSFSYFLRERLFCRANLDRMSILTWDILEPIIARFFGNRTFTDLKIPLSISVIDLKHDSEVWLKTGKLSDCMKASIAFPGLLPPVTIGERELVSSTFYSELPLARIRKIDAPVVAVDQPTSMATQPPHSLLEIVASTDELRSTFIKQKLLGRADYVFRLEDMTRFRWGRYQQIPQMVAQAKRETDRLIALNPELIIGRHKIPGRQ